MRKLKKVGVYPVLYVIYSITLTLFVLGIFLFFVLQAQKFSRIIKENVEMQVYLNKKITENDIIRLRQLLNRQHFLLKKDGRAQIEFVTKEAAAKKMIQETGEDFLQLLADNPLRDMYILKIDPSYYTVQNFSKIKKNIEKLEGVFEVVYLEDLVETIYKNFTKIGFILLIFLFFLFSIVIILVHNTIKLATYSQRFLIRSMQLVGATSNFIRKPFLIRSLLIGLISSSVASILLLMLFNYIHNHFLIDMSAQSPFIIILLIIFILLIGIFISFVSTYLAISKYLNTSLDDLY